MEPISLKPLFIHRILGGTSLRDNLGYEIPSKNNDECWAISSHENGNCVVLNEKFKGFTLSKLWNDPIELFGNTKVDNLPLLTKILDPNNNNLSVKVHPNIDYAKINENGELDKTECLYIIDNAEMIFGHNAKSRE